MTFPGPGITETLYRRQVEDSRGFRIVFAGWDGYDGGWQLLGMGCVSLLRQWRNHYE